MPVNINNPSGAHSQRLDTIKRKAEQSNQAVKQQAVQTPAQPQKKDSVSITAQAQELHGLKDKLTNTPSVNQQKVQDIRKAIEAGEYKVDTGKLAANMAQFEGELNKIFS